MKCFLFTLALLFSFSSFSQYIGVKAKYTDTRLVDHSPYPPTRENRLVLTFFYVPDGVHYTPARLVNYPIYLLKEGLQYGSETGGVTDSSGNNYPGYIVTAPKAVAYSNTLQVHYIECDSTATTGYFVNGSELDCGFIPVSHWVDDVGQPGVYKEIFTAPNICLPFYTAPDMYTHNVNFTFPIPPTEPYNVHLFGCGLSPKYSIQRGVLPGDTGSVLMTLAVTLTDETVHLNDKGEVRINWTNLTESGVWQYVIERSTNGTSFEPVQAILPNMNDGSKALYQVWDSVAGLPGTLFYRIKVLESTGKFVYSKVLSVQYKGRSSLLSIFPNPTRDGKICFSMNDLSKNKVVLTVMNAAGSVQTRSAFEHPGGPLRREISVLPLPPGLYWLRLQSGTTDLVSKVVVL